MIYIVSGYMRSMTSAMMRGLIAGGMDPVYNRDRDEFFTRTFADAEGYHPNATGFFELSLQEIRAIGFPRQHEGKLIKILYEGVGNLAVLESGYRVAIMIRDPVEIFWSYKAFFGVAPPFAQHTTEETLAAYRALIQELHATCVNRRDVRSVHLVSAKALVADPLRVYGDLAAAGWPVDAEKAAATIDRKAARFEGPALPQEVNLQVVA